MIASIGGSAGASSPVAVMRPASCASSLMVGPPVQTAVPNDGFAAPTTRSVTIGSNTFSASTTAMSPLAAMLGAGAMMIDKVDAWSAPSGSSFTATAPPAAVTSSTGTTAIPMLD